MYRTLDAARVAETLERLHRRIEERFPGAGLAAVCAELATVAARSRTRAEALARPDWRLRALLAAVLLIGAGLLVALGLLVFSGTHASRDLFETLSGIDSAFNIVLVMGASVFFLVRLEDRRRRNRTMRALHELRAFVHVIDMHQLTKSPMATVGAAPTPSSPVRSLSPQDLVRYLDYCSEMLALTAKVAAVYAQFVPDAEITEAVSDLERTVTGLSQKIWQKINIIHNDLAAVAAEVP